MYNIITVGDATLDIFITIDKSSSQCHVDKKKEYLSLAYGDKIYASDIHQAVGGNAANVAVGLAKTGHSVAILSQLGNDKQAEAIIDALIARGVQTNHIIQKKKEVTRTSCIINYAAERTVLSYHASRTYALGTLPKTEWIYATSMGKGFEKTYKQILSYKKNQPHSNIAFNPGSYQLSHAVKEIRQFLSVVDVLFVNKEEAQQIIGKKISNHKTMLHSLQKEYAIPYIVLTDGAQGSYALYNEQAYHMPIYPLPPLSKTGAGDAYASGFLTALLAKKDVPTCMQWGSANACAVTQHHGAQEGLSTKKQLQQFIKTYPSIIATSLS